MSSVCYILSYRDPDYVRTRTLISALQKIDAINLFEARNSSKGFWRYFQTLWKLIIIRISKNPDSYILGFRGYELFWPVRMLTFGKQLIYDHMMSPYDSLLNERKSIKMGSLFEKIVYQYEKSILHSADIIITDTNIHKKIFQSLFDLSPDKIHEVPVGTDEQLFTTKQNFSNTDPLAMFEVLFYGSFLPLHGVEFIIDAASKLRHLPIHFTLIGGKKTNSYYQLLKKTQLTQVTHLEWVEFELLPKLVSAVNLGLGGPFGDTNQARRVVTGKTLQFLAMAKPVIIGEIAPEYGFKDKVNCLMVPQGNGSALADAITWAFEHRDQMQQIGTQGYELYLNQYSIKQITQKLKGIINHEI